VRKYLVLGTYEDDGARWADSYEAESPQAAEEMALADYPGIVIAGVVPASVPCLCGCEHQVEILS